MKTIALLALTLSSLFLASPASAGSRDLRPGERVVVGNGEAFGTIVDIAGGQARLRLSKPYPCTGCDRTVADLSALFREAAEVRGFRVGTEFSNLGSVFGRVTHLYENGVARVALYKPYPCTTCSTSVLNVSHLAARVRDHGGFREGEVVGLPPDVRGKITHLFADGTARITLFKPYPCGSSCTSTVANTKHLHKVWSSGERPDWAREPEETPAAEGEATSAR